MPPAYNVVKANYSTIFTEPLLGQLVQQLVADVTPIVQLVSKASLYHVTRLLGANQLVGPIDHTYFNRITAAVTRAIDGSEPFDHRGLADSAHPDHETAAGQQCSAIAVSLDDFIAELPLRYQLPARPAAYKDVSAFDNRLFCVRPHLLQSSLIRLYTHRL